MARVFVTAGECDAYTGGLRQFEIAASDVRGLVRALDERFPGLQAMMEDHVSLAVDGEIIPAWTGSLKPDSEVALIPRLGGG